MTSNKSTRFDPQNVPLNGLCQVHTPKSPEFDVVLIHSIGGNTRNTWTSQTSQDGIATEVYWPAWPLFNSSSRGRILVFGYDGNVSSFTQSDHSSCFLGYAQTLIAQLACFRTEDPFRPLMFVGNGLGGYLIKECMRLSRAVNDPELQNIARATLSIVFICCPHADGKKTKLFKAVSKVLKADRAVEADALVADFRRNLDSIQQLQADFMSFLEERAPMLKIWTIQEPSRCRVDGAVVDERPMLEDDLLDLQYRYESFETAHCRYDILSKIQFRRDWSVREACWELSRSKLSVDRHRILPLHKEVAELYRNKDVESVLQLLSANGEACARIGIVGQQGSGKTHVALGVCDHISEASSLRDRSIFWINAESKFTIDMDLNRISSQIGAGDKGRDDRRSIVMDFLKSRYSGDWILVFDNVNDKSIFLDPFQPINSLRHTPKKRRLLDMLPSKPNCSILFLAREASDLAEILDSMNSKTLHVSRPTIEEYMCIIEDLEQQLQKPDTTNPLCAGTKRRLAECFGFNPTCLIQVVNQVLRNPDLLDEIYGRLDATISETERLTLTSRIAVDKLKAESPNSLALLASLVVLDTRKIPKWLAMEFCPSKEPQCINTLRRYALVNSWTCQNEGGKKASYFSVHPYALSIVKAAFTKSQWETHMRQIILTLCHAFMQLASDWTKVNDFFTAARAVSTELVSVLRPETTNTRNNGSKVDDRDESQRVQRAETFVAAELAEFAEYFRGSWRGETFHIAVRHVFHQIATGDWHKMKDGLAYGSRFRGGPGRNSGSQPMWYYIGTKPSVQEYLYD